MEQEQDIIVDDKSEYVPCPNGFHDAVCVDVEDLGITATNFGPKHKVRLTWQTNKVKDDGSRYLAFKNYNAKLTKGSELRKDLECWRGSEFGEEEAKGFRLQKVIGFPCRIQTVQEKSKKNGNMYANVKVVAPYDGTTPLQPLDYVRVKDRPKSEASQGTQASTPVRQPYQAPAQPAAAIPPGMTTPEAFAAAQGAAAASRPAAF